MAQKVASPGFKVNLDFGTIIENGEHVDMLKGHVKELNHVHISEPNLMMLEKRPAHRTLAALLRDEGYGGFVSIEMRAQPLDEVRRAVAWVAEVFA